MSTAQPFLIALSGPTSSGKTTVATALSSIFSSISPIAVLHADDFYKPDSQTPLHSNGLQDWDCAAALDLPRFRDTLRRIKDGGEVPPRLVKQGGIYDGVHGNVRGLPNSFIEQATEEVKQWPWRAKGRKIVLVEGFLLFGAGVKDELADLFDLKILLRASREQAMQRRKSRNGYVTLEGFWQDPEGYFEEIVWPNFVKDHGFLFEGGDVEGKAQNAKENGVTVSPGIDADLQQTCEWVLECVKDTLWDHDREADGF